MNVLFLTNVPSPYRVAFFNELGKLCNLTVLFEKNTSDERNSSWKKYTFENFKGIFLQGISSSTDTAFCPNVIKYLSMRKYDVIVVHSFSSLTGIISVLKMKLLRIPYYLEADGATAKNGKGFKERFKKFLLSGAKGYFSSGKSCDSYFIAYGAKKEKIYRYPFTSLSNSDILTSTLSNEKKKEIRSELSLTENKIVISVGRFSYQNGYGKGYDTLLKVSEKISHDIGIYIIGDEPTEGFIQWKTDKKLDHVHFISFKPKSELNKYYQAADLSVLLSRGEAWGLVINESMANGCPVITTDACVAGLELIENGKNGYIVPVDAVDEVTSIMSAICEDDMLQQNLSLNTLETINGYTIERMAEIHIKAFIS